MKQNIIISKQFKSELATAISECEKDKIFVLVDETTRELCWELIKDDFCLKEAQVITIGTTDSCNLGGCVGGLTAGRGYASLVVDKPGWWYGDRPWWLCGINIQAGH